MLSVVIPARNAAASLEATIAGLRTEMGGGFIGEVLIVDGGSEDGTPALARSLGAKVIESPPGRGLQLARGGAAAAGPWLLFLHADTVLSPGWAAAVCDFIRTPESASRAAVFRYRLNDGGRAARRLERIVAWRTRWLGLPYGDQGLLIAKDFYQSLGGFRPLTLMEDVDMIRRIGRHRLAVLAADATTSAARYRQSGYLPRMALNALCLSLYLLRVSPRLIARIYG